MVSEHGLGRIPSFDERSRDYPIRALSVGPIRTKTWRRPLALDQGNTPQCVGYSLWGAYNTGPLTSTYSLTKRHSITPTDIYNGAQTLDEWPGTDYEGSSVLGGVKWLKANGFISEYRWCFSLDDVLTTLSNVGPVVVGTDWLTEMFNGPDPDPGRTASLANALPCLGDVAGGHAWELHGINVTEQIVIATNSWSPSWGDEGRMYVKWDDLQRLLDNQGEALVIL
jgi:hypothetical protein